jgi:hypothetical protein
LCCLPNPLRQVPPPFCFVSFFFFCFFSFFIDLQSTSRGRPCGHCIRKGYSHLCSDAPPSPSSSTTPPTTAALRKRRREPSTSSKRAAVDQRKNQQFGDLLQAVGLLTAEVRDLAADNRQMRADLEAMRGQQHATNQQLASVLTRTTTPTTSSTTLTVTPPPLPTSSTMWPSRALLEAHEARASFPSCTTTPAWPASPFLTLGTQLSLRWLVVVVKVAADNYTTCADTRCWRACTRATLYSTQSRPPSCSPTRPCVGCQATLSYASPGCRLLRRQPFHRMARRWMLV